MAQPVAALPPIHVALFVPFSLAFQHLDFTTNQLFFVRDRAKADGLVAAVDAERDILHLVRCRVMQLNREGLAPSNAGPTLAQQQPGFARGGWHQRLAVLVEYKYFHNASFRELLRSPASRLWPTSSMLACGLATATLRLTLSDV